MLQMVLLLAIFIMQSLGVRIGEDDDVVLQPRSKTECPSDFIAKAFRDQEKGDAFRALTENVTDALINHYGGQEQAESSCADDEIKPKSFTNILRFVQLFVWADMYRASKIESECRNQCSPTKEFDSECQMWSCCAADLIADRDFSTQDMTKTLKGVSTDCTTCKESIRNEVSFGSLSDGDELETACFDELDNLVPDVAQNCHDDWIKKPAHEELKKRFGGEYNRPEPVKLEDQCSFTGSKSADLLTFSAQVFPDLNVDVPLVAAIPNVDNEHMTSDQWTSKAINFVKGFSYPGVNTEQTHKRKNHCLTMLLNKPLFNRCLEVDVGGDHELPRTPTIAWPQ